MTTILNNYNRKKKSSNGSYWAQCAVAPMLQWLVHDRDRVPDAASSWDAG